MAFGVLKDQGVPANPHDEVAGLWAECIETLVQFAGTRIAAIGDRHLTAGRRAAQQRLSTPPTGDLQMAEAATAKVVDRMDAPVGSRTPRTADRAGVGQVHATPRPQHRWTSPGGQQTSREGAQEGDRA